jgi:pyruvate kinase
MARTKIVATIGPASSDPQTIRQLIRAGMNVARINFSHGDHETHTTLVQRLRQIAAEENSLLAVLGDLQGPKLRLGYVGASGVQLNMGDSVVLTPHRGQPGMVHLPHPDLIETAEVGARLVVGDGEVELRVIDKKRDTLRCQVTVPGLLESRKGIHAPRTSLPISCLTAKDREDLKLVCRLELDYVALSFVRTAGDIEELRALIGQETEQEIPIIAKIEQADAIDHLDEISTTADGVMVARGDLGLEVPPQEVPLLQKRIIARSNQVGIPVITATQMLQSMVNHPRPTRAEASDVANAILDGTDAVMLSQETASGSYPVEAVIMMRHISEMTEREFPYDIWQAKRRKRQRDASSGSVTEAISAASCAVAEEVAARAIVSTTMSGYTARQIARHRPATPIVAVTPNPRTQRRLALVWGVESLVVDQHFDSTDHMLAQTVRALNPGTCRVGDRIVITAGIPFGHTGQSNLIQVHEVGESNLPLGSPGEPRP